jgi:hypothetical protein
MIAVQETINHGLDPAETRVELAAALLSYQGVSP